MKTNFCINFIRILLVSLALLMEASCDKDSDLFGEMVLEENMNESDDDVENSDEESSEDEESEEENEEEESEDENSDDANEESDNQDNDETEDDSTDNPGNQSGKFDLIFDTDANNELDDQHAIAYLLTNGDFFNVEGITVNTTSSGGGIDNHYQEASRVVRLFGLENTVPIYKGANGKFSTINNNFNPNNFDGDEAVNFILEKSLEKPIVIVAVGKLTNVALALRKDPSLADRAVVIWLGSNYPSSGEYNMINDFESVNYVLENNIPFEMVIVRYNQPSGTDAVRVTQNEINTRMPGLGPMANSPVTGRHGGLFSYFGDYSISLFERIYYSDDTRSRAMHDVVPLALMKNPEWGAMRTMPAPILVGGAWQDRPDNTREIILWESFNSDEIISDFFVSMENYILVE